MNISPLQKFKNINNFCIHLPLKPLGLIEVQNNKLPHYCFFNPYDLSPCIVPHAFKNINEIFGRCPPSFWDIEKFKKENVPPKRYLQWLKEMCYVRGFIDYNLYQQYNKISPKILSLLPEASEKRIAMESYCLFIDWFSIENNPYEEEIKIPHQWYHALDYIDKISMSISIDTQYIVIKRKLITNILKILQNT